MKKLYIILFCADALVLVGLSFLLLKSIDEQIQGIKLTEMAGGILLSIVLLVFFLHRYIKLPTQKNENNLID